MGGTGGGGRGAPLLSAAQHFSTYGAMSGEAYLPANMEETVLNTLVMLMGIVVMAFLVGELSNILGNFDPVGNEFEQTVDNLDVRSRRPVV